MRVLVFGCQSGLGLNVGAVSGFLGVLGVSGVRVQRFWVFGSFLVEF